MAIQEFDPQLVDQFESWVDDPEVDVVDKLWPEVHPHMAQREVARRAALLTMASNADKAGMRGRCHLLLVGPPGTGKTEIRDWVRHHIPGAHGIGPKSSSAGLKGDASGGDLTPGALAMAHDGMICIEELDKFAKCERDALYEAMSEGRYEINQGEIREVVQAEVRCVATCNGVEKFADAIVDRFDFVIEMDEYNEEETVEVSDSLFDSFVDGFVDGEIDRTKEVVPEYLRWIDPYEPGATDEFRSKVKQMKNYLIQQEQMTGAIRKKQAWLRVAYTYAKLNKRDMSPDDFIAAIDLLYPDEDFRRPLEAIRDDNPDKLWSS
jgi:DNA replicative helicase MCM subunit Mcm2 (Cdc46/Mcm family)